MTFIDARLLDCVARGTEGGPTWSTRKVGLRSGHIRRNANRVRPLYRYTILYQALNPEYHADVIDAFNACRGGLHSFRLKDWADFEADQVQLPELGTGSPQQVQLRKPYVFGGQTLWRPIRKPVASTVTMTANGAPLAATIDYATGIASFTAAIGAVIEWSGEFDVPVMFEDDALSFQAVSRGRQGLFLTADVSLLEDISV